MIQDVATIITSLGSDATVEGDTIKVGGERIRATLTGKVVAQNNSHKVTLGTCQDDAHTLAHAFINTFR